MYQNFFTKIQGFRITCGFKHSSTRIYVWWEPFNNKNYFIPCLQKTNGVRNLQKLALVVIVILVLSIAAPLDSYAQKIRPRPQPPATLQSLQTDLKNLEVKARQVILNINDTSKQFEEDQKITTMILNIQATINQTQTELAAMQKSVTTTQDMVNLARGVNPTVYKEQQAIQNVQNSIKQLDNYLQQIEHPPAPPPPPPPPPTQEQLNAAEIKGMQSTLDAMNTQVKKYISKLTLYHPTVKQANDDLQKLQAELNGIQKLPVDNQTAAIKQIKPKIDSEWTVIRMIDPFNTLGGYFSGF